MNLKQFLFEKNDCKVYKLTVLNHSYFIVEHAGKRYIRKSSAGVNGLISFLKEKAMFWKSIDNLTSKDPILLFNNYYPI